MSAHLTVYHSPLSGSVGGGDFLSDLPLSVRPPAGTHESVRGVLPTDGAGQHGHGPRRHRENIHQGGDAGSGSGEWWEDPGDLDHLKGGKLLFHRPCGHFKVNGIWWLTKAILCA